MTRSNDNISTRVRPRARHSMQLAEPLLRRLNGYRLAAGAAGVALLGYSSAAEAAPVCGTLSIALSSTETYAFNPALQKVAPFNVAQTYNELSSLSQSRMMRGFFTPNTPGAKVLLSANGLPEDLASEANIGPGAKFGKARSYGVLFEYHHYNKFIGPFKSLQVGYVGFQFSEQGQTHYGWVRLQVTRQGHSYPSLVLSQFGYESTPNAAIQAGNCTGSTAGAVSEPGQPAKGQRAQAREANAVPDNDAVAESSPGLRALGLLALGCEGVPLWRRQNLL